MEIIDVIAKDVELLRKENEELRTMLRELRQEYAIVMFRAARAVQQMKFGESMNSALMKRIDEIINQKEKQ